MIKLLEKQEKNAQRMPNHKHHGTHRGQVYREKRPESQSKSEGILTEGILSNSLIDFIAGCS
ncbi:hypothetical protein KKC22_03685 [Myxococcota bacterium]|jgi:hypothetical protein|nr:hypothetical protein [Myxococcota bacterium]